MATVNYDSLRNEYNAMKRDLEASRKNGNITENAYKTISTIYDMMEVMMAVTLEKTTKNSGIPDRQGRNQKVSAEET